MCSSDLNDETKEADWEEISQDEIYELDDTSALLNPHFQDRKSVV